MEIEQYDSVLMLGEILTLEGDQLFINNLKF